MKPPGHAEPASPDELDPDEPRTPLWLPLLGLCLFIVAFVYLMVGGKPSPAQEGTSAEPAPSAAPTPP